MRTPVLARFGGLAAAVLGSEYGSTRLGEVDMLRELVLAIGIPLLVLLLAVLALEQWRDLRKAEASCTFHHSHPCAVATTRVITISPRARFH